MASHGRKVCNNCGSHTHIFRQCKQPITSCGVIAYREYQLKQCDSDITIREYLMICRKDSLGFVEFMRGKYSLDDETNVHVLIDEMTNNEKKRLLTHPFEKLWKALWMDEHSRNYRREFEKANEKYKTILKGFMYKGAHVSLPDLIVASKTSWEEPEWGFPKGRRNARETDIACAKREFQEESGMPCHHSQLIENISPFCENFVGSNQVSYCHKYFLAKIPYTSQTSLDVRTSHQRKEISKIEWLTLDQALLHIRHYNTEKKETLCRVDSILAKNIVK